MGLFRKKALICPICRDELPEPTVGANYVHWEDHLVEGRNSEGAARWKWHCSCGEQPEGAWDNPTAAVAGLSLHMGHRHGMPF